MRFLRTGMCIATCLGVYAIYGEQISSAVETMDRQAQLGSRILPSLAKKPLQTPKETITRSKVLEGTAVVIDGNTIEIASQKVGLLKYRACSPGQMAKTASGDMDCGLWAKESLEGFTDNRTLRCIIHLRDHANVLQADCVRDDHQDVGIFMIRGGYGLANRNYPASPEMKAAATQAQANKVGIWNFKNFTGNRAG